MRQIIVNSERVKSTADLLQLLDYELKVRGKYFHALFLSYILGNFTLAIGSG